MKIFLNEFINEQKKTKQNANDAFQQWAKKRNLSVNVGHEDRQASTNRDYFRAVEVNESFIDVLNNIGATMEPSLKELEEKMDRNNFKKCKVTITCGGTFYLVDVEADMLSKRFSLWLNMNQFLQHDWESIDSDGWTMECKRCGRHVYIEEEEDWDKGMEERCTAF